MAMEINVNRNIFARSRRDQERKKQRVMDMILEKETTSNHMYSFKLEPGTNGIPDRTETRPMPKCCDHCMVESAMASEDAKYLGLEDCFRPATMSSYNPTIVKMFPFYYHYLRMANLNKYKLPTFKQLEEDSNIVSLYPEEMFDQPNMLATTKNAILKEVRKLQVAAVWKRISEAFFRFSMWICQKLLSSHFESVLVHKAEIEMLKHVNQTQLPIVYIPTFRSKWDTTLILWTLAHHGIQPPLFMASHLGKSWFGKYFGAIGSSLKVKPDDRYSELRYSSALSLYLRHILRNGNPLLVNLECRRSRTGRPSAEVYGSEILKIISDEFSNGKIEDVYFVPMSISYEVLPEAKDILSSKRCSNGWNLFASVFQFFKWPFVPSSQKGKVRIDFAKPFCLREFTTSMKGNPKIQRCLVGEVESYFRSRDCAYLRWDSSESLNSVSSIYGELFPLYPDGNSNEDKSQATFLDVLNYHIMFEAGHCESVMPTHMLAFLLMKKHRNGVNLESLKADMIWLKKFLESCKKDFGFAIRNCDTESIILRAIHLLDGDVSCEWIENQATFEIKPVPETESLRRLDYYANYIFPLFVMKSIIATAIFSMCGTELTALRGFNQELCLKDEDFIYHCRRIYEVFAGAFLIHPSCMTIEAAIRKVVNRMADEGLLTLVIRQRRAYHWDEFSDEEDFYTGQENQQSIAIEQDFNMVPEEVKLYTSLENYQTLNFYRNLMTPYLDIYAFLASNLKALVNEETPFRSNEMLMNKFQDVLLTKLQESKEDFVNCRELLNKETVKSFLVSCEDHSIIYCRIEAKTLLKFYGLENSFNSEEKLDDLTNNILHYISK
ncbi:unnamed protein product [Orchesella dallaii]|uniref:Phospholipid/glycerol acyltransferase domain-containing protein n=1 Tax=Orchesella dallaii TaxID=48710 RepID=A0ABP1QU32_9HEXA